MTNRLIASMDLGSNTFRLLLAELVDGTMQSKQVFQHIPRLSESLVPGGAFAPAALLRAEEALADFAARIQGAGPVKVTAGATMAARLSSDGPGFIEGLAKRYGWETEILKAEDEARLTALGALSDLDPVPERGLIFDIGGRSTEFVETGGLKTGRGLSLPLGVVGLTESHLKSDPPSADELEAVAANVRDFLNRAGFDKSSAERPTLIGTAGTVTTVAALILKITGYRPELINNQVLKFEAIAELLKTLARKTVTLRVIEDHLPPRRADAIVAGLIMIVEIMKFWRAEILTVSDSGLLEALWLRAAGLIS